MPVASLIRNAKPFTRALEQALAYEPRLEQAIDLIADIKGRRLPPFLQFLLYEYGLLELTPYVPNPYVLLDQGRAWQYERDTLAAITRGLSFISVTAALVESPARREWWNSFQLYLSALPPDDGISLDRIDRITSLGKPFQSDFRRGVSGYDVPALEGDWTLLDGSFLDRDSGVQLRANGPLWSFGRISEISHTMTEAEGTALGNWIEPISEIGYLIKFFENTAIIDGDAHPVSDAMAFSRAGAKWAQRLDGTWQKFAANTIAATNRGALFEPAGTRISTFNLTSNPLADYEPTESAAVTAIGLADPLGGYLAIQVTFSDAGRTLYVPTDTLAAETEYSVSFFAKLISFSGVTGSDLATLQSVFPDLAIGQWVRVEGSPYATLGIDGNWLDITIAGAGVVVVQLFGFQVEAGQHVTSPIEGTAITGSRAADVVTLHLPSGDQDILLSFDNGTSQTRENLSGEYVLNPASLPRPYVVDIGDSRGGTWLSMAFPWTAATFPWASTAVAQRAALLATWFDERLAYMCLRRADNTVIGYRRLRVKRQVRVQFNGPYDFAGADYAISEDGQFVMLEAMTDRGNGVGSTVARVEVVFGGALASGVKPGKLWLAPGQLIGGTAINAGTLSVPLRESVRDKFKVLLGF